jgi:hypothetical protein
VFQPVRQRLNKRGNQLGDARKLLALKTSLQILDAREVVAHLALRARKRER